MSELSIEQLTINLHETTEAKNRIDILNELAWVSRHTDRDASKAYLEEAKTISTESAPDYKKGMIDNLVVLSYHCIHSSRYADAIDSLTRTEDFYTSTDDKHGLLRCWALFMSVYYALGNPTLEMEHALKLLKLARELDDGISQASAYQHIGIVYDIEGDYEKAIESYSNALHHYEEAGKALNTAITLDNLATSYRKFKQYDLALEHSLGAYTQHEKGKALHSMAVSLGIRGHIYEDMQELDKALSCHHQKLELANEIDDDYLRGYIFGDIGRVMTNQGRASDAIPWLQSAIDVSEKNGVKYSLIEALEAIVKAYRSLENFREAFAYHAKLSDAREALHKERSEKERNNLIVLHETEQAKLEANLQRERAEQLQASERRFRALIEKSSDVILKIDVKGLVTYVSPQFSEITTLNAQDIIGRDINQLINDIATQPTADIQTIILQNAIPEKGDSVAFELPIMNRDGQTVWLRGVVTNLLDDPDVRSFVINVHNITELKQAIDREQDKGDFIQTLLELTTLYHEYLPLETILRQILTQLQNLYRNDYLSISIVDHMAVQAVATLTGDDFIFDDSPQHNLELSDHPLFLMMAENKASLILHDADVPIFDPDQPQFSTYMGIPVIFSDNILAFLNFYHRETKQLEASMQQQLEALASHIAVVLYNYQTYSKARQNAIENERKRIAREFHDVVSQELFSATMIAQALPHIIDTDVDGVREGLQRLYNITKAVSADMRILLLELGPEKLMQIPIGQLINGLVESAKLRASKTTFDLTLDCQQEITSSETKRNIYRIVQESINNILKHSEATHVAIRFSCQHNSILLVIEDDGKGFNIDELNQTGMGLDIMQGRASDNNLSLTIDSQPGRGTRIEVHSIEL
ncbi:MAG: tetratricopeptide repeat protein [Anaerolineae bacterium]|nr:tetratricopeptide repeat protein [Anaerolineae bacterium]